MIRSALAAALAIGAAPAFTCPPSTVPIAQFVQDLEDNRGQVLALSGEISDSVQMLTFQMAFLAAVPGGVAVIPVMIVSRVEKGCVVTAHGMPRQGWDA